MKDIIVITSFTGRLGLVDAYQQRLVDAGIETCFETVLTATSSFTMDKRIGYWCTLAKRFIDYEQIFVTDAWDVLFLGTKQDLLNKPRGVTISAERNCFPGLEFGYEDLTDKIVGPTPWKYANPGMMTANPQCLLEWLDKARKFIPLDISDQAWCNRRLADFALSDELGLVPIDTNTSLFYVISYNDGRLEDGSLQIKNDRLWNSTCDSYPNFVHFAGHGPLEAQRVLPGHEAPRYDAMRVIRQLLESGK